MTIPKHIVITLKVYALALIIFTLFRVALFFVSINKLHPDTPFNDILYAFFMGIRFDVVISGYILVLPFVLLTILLAFRKNDSIRHISFYYIFIMFSMAFLVCAADIPYFEKFFTRFTVTAFAWMDNPVFVLKMIFEEPRFWIFILPFILVVFVFYTALQRAFQGLEKVDAQPIRLGGFLLYSTLFLLLMLTGIRGRLDEKSPLRIGTAYFSNDSFLNQLGLNPNFTLIRSLLDAQSEEGKPIELMDENKALARVQQDFHIVKPESVSPIARMKNLGGREKKSYNVIIVLMESMSASYMKRQGNTENLTPFLDSLSNRGRYFNNAYSAGIHTYNGVFSTLFSFPAIFTQHPMKTSPISKYHGLATTLRNNNYSTIYFTTHDGQFDNIEGFLKENDFENVISKQDYPSDSSKTTLGVPDDYMFRFSMPLLADLYKQEKPFLAVYLTSSNHAPYYIPDYFVPHTKDISKGIVEYADFSLRKFIQISEKEPWFKNTIFVFLADHGSALRIVYDLSLDYNHIPLLFYAPHIFKENTLSHKMAGQIDVFPSIMGLLQIPYQNNTLGINLFEETRPYIYFNADDKYGVIDSSWLLIVRKDKQTGLYQYRTENRTNYATRYPHITTKMMEYAASNLQTYQYILNKGKM